MLGRLKTFLSMETGSYNAEIHKPQARYLRSLSMILRSLVIEISTAMCSCNSTVQWTYQCAIRQHDKYQFRRIGLERLYHILPNKRAPDFWPILIKFSALNVQVLKRSKTDWNQTRLRDPFSASMPGTFIRRNAVHIYYAGNDCQTSPELQFIHHINNVAVVRDIHQTREIQQLAGVIS